MTFILKVNYLEEKKLKGEIFLVKKILITAGITMAMFVGAYGLNCSSANAVQKNLSSANAIHMVQPHDTDKIIETLKKEGTIPANATDAQIQEILKNYLKEEFQPLTQEEKTLKTQQEKIVEDYVEVQSQKQMNLKSEAPSSGKVDNVQPKDWNGTERKDKLLTILVEFPDFKHNSTPEGLSAMWLKDFNEQHYQDLMFGDKGWTGPGGKTFLSMKNYYEQQSGGSFTFEGTVIPWFTAAHPAAYYGKNAGSNHNPKASTLVAEAVLAAQKVVNFSDYDKDKDGVPDHIAIIYAGIGEEEGGGLLGTDAIWSHSSAIQSSKPIGTIPAYAVIPYVMMPENGAEGVFCHEFGHQLGLPDEYDTEYSGNGEPVSDWSIMSGGSWAGIVPGTEPTGFSPRCKEFLQATMPGSNWLNNGQVINLKNMTTGSAINFKLDQASTKGTNHDYIRINLPDKEKILTTPTSGKYAYYSGNNTVTNPTSMSTQVDLTGKTSIKLTFKTLYDIEEDYDLATIQVKEQGTQDWVDIKGNITKDTAGTDASTFGTVGINGTSNGEWVSAEYDLSAYANKKIDLKMQYQCDTGVFLQGVFVDDINIVADGTSIFSDDVEGAPKFTLAGFQKSDCIGRYANNYYIEWRNYAGVDMGLKNNLFGKTSLVGYDPGMVVWYDDESFTDNWTGVHPGEGFIGVVDADQGVTMFKPVDPSKSDILPTTEALLHDAAFSLRKSQPVTIDYSYKTDIPRIFMDNDTFMNPIFDDSKSYVNSLNPDGGRIIPELGLKIYVTGESKDRSVGTITIVKTK